MTSSVWTDESDPLDLPLFAYSFVLTWLNLTDKSDLTDQMRYISAGWIHSICKVRLCVRPSAFRFYYCTPQKKKHKYDLSEEVEHCWCLHNQFSLSERSLENSTPVPYLVMNGSEYEWENIHVCTLLSDSWSRPTQINLTIAASVYFLI